MVTTRKSSDTPDEGGGADTRTSGFSEEQRSELAALIAEAVGAGKPPAAGRDAAPDRPTVSDSEWDAMSDRKRESWVRDLVVGVLDDLAREDDEARLRADVDSLKRDKEPEPEAPPSVVTKIQRVLWGDPDKVKK